MFGSSAKLGDADRSTSALFFELGGYGDLFLLFSPGTPRHGSDGGVVKTWSTGGGLESDPRRQPDSRSVRASSVDLQWAEHDYFLPAFG